MLGPPCSSHVCSHRYGGVHDEGARRPGSYDGRFNSWYLQLSACVWNTGPSPERRDSLSRTFVCAGAVPSTGLVPPPHGSRSCQIELPPGSNLTETRSVAEEVRQRLTNSTTLGAFYDSWCSQLERLSSRRPHRAQSDAHRAICKAARQAGATQADSSRRQGTAEIGRAPVVGVGGFGEKLQITSRATTAICCRRSAGWSAMCATQARERDSSASSCSGDRHHAVSRGCGGAGRAEGTLSAATRIATTAT